jgi:hypothetical protein
MRSVGCHIDVQKPTKPMQQKYVSKLPKKINMPFATVTKYDKDFTLIDVRSYNLPFFFVLLCVEKDTEKILF